MITVEWTEQELEEMWSIFMRDSIQKHVPLIATIKNDDSCKGAIVLNEIFLSYWHEFQQMQVAEKKGEELTLIQKEIYTEIVEKILLPILQRMEEWGYVEWVEKYELPFVKREMDVEHCYI